MTDTQWKWWQYGLFAFVSLLILIGCGSYLITSHPLTHANEGERTIAILGLAVSVVLFPHSLMQFVRTSIVEYWLYKSLT